MTSRRELKKLQKEWEQRLTDLDVKWSHWWIEGDGAFLAIVPGEELLGAVKVISENHERFASIFVHRARVDSEDNPCRQKQRFEIANRRSDGQSAE